MKKTILIVIIALLGLSQQAKAQLYVGGSLGFNAGFNDERFSSVSISPDIGYGYGNWNFGAVLNINTFSNNNDGLASLRLGITPYVEYYFFSAGPVSLFAEAGIGLIHAMYFTADDPKNQFLFNPYLAPGIEVSLTDHFSVMCHLGRFEWDSETSNLGFSMSGESLALGLYYSF